MGKVVGRRLGRDVLIKITAYLSDLGGTVEAIQFNSLFEVKKRKVDRTGQFSKMFFPVLGIKPRVLCMLSPLYHPSTSCLTS
jgi:hypothetical protein